MKNIKISGRVIDLATGKGIAGLRVEAWSAIPRAKDPLATATTKKQGGFQLDIDEDAEEVKPGFRLRVYRDSQLLMGEYLRKVFRPEEWDEDIIIVLHEGKESGGEVVYMVQGTVTEPTGSPAVGVKVQISNQGLRSATVLKEATTGAQGNYSIQYTVSAPADLSAAVYGTNGTLLYQSTTADIVYKAGPQTTLNIQLTTASAPPPVEFDTILAALTPLVGNVPIDQLGETAQNQDITYLAGETGIDYTYLEYFVLSYKVQASFQLLPAFTYGLLREGALMNPSAANPMSLRTVISVSTDVTGLVYDIVLLPAATVQTEIATAIQSYLIDDISAQLPGIQAQLAALQPAAQNYVQTQRPQQLMNMLSQALSSGSYKGLQEALQTNYNGDLPAMLQAITAANPFSGGTAAGGTTGTGGSGTGGLPPGMSLDDLLQVELHKAFLADFEKDTDSPFPQKGRMLDAMKKKAGVNLGTSNIDAQLLSQGLPEETRRDLRKLQRLYKLTPHYRQVKALHQGGLHSAFQIVSLGRKQFVRKYTQNKTFSTDKEAQKVYDRATVAHTAAWELAGQLRDYASLGRWKSIGGSATAGTTKGSGSAAPSSGMASHFGQPDLHTRITGPSGSGGSGSGGSGGSGGSVSAVLQAVNANFPNYASLFQGVADCACDDCRNVYSPAAYMVDVLQFLANRMVLGGTMTAQDVLFSRRPDLGDLDLNCNNAYTEVPYIDLVCEILEQAVSPDPGLALDSSYTADLVPGLIDAHLLTPLQAAGYSITSAAIIYPSFTEGIVTVYIIRDTMITLEVSQTTTGWNARELHQSHLSQTELLACPEYVNAAAYTLLANSALSFSLPFDLYQEEGEALLSTAGVKREQLMAAFQAPAGLTEAQIAAVALAIPPGDATLIETANPGQQFVYWNTSAATLLTTVNEVDIFLQKSQLAYTDLQNMLAQSFVNPSNTIYIKHEDSTCNPAKKLLINLDLNALDRMHRFIRLWNKTTMTMEELNDIITYPQLGNNTLDGQVLVYLYGLQMLQNTLGLTLDQSISFYGLIPDDGSTGLYQSTFYNSMVTNPVNPAFNPINVLANEGLPAGSQATLTDPVNLATLCTCLQLTTANVTLILQQLTTLSGVANPPITRANLAFVYANSLLASSLGMALADMYNLAALSGTTLFTSPAAGQYFFTSPDSTNAFIQTANFVLNSGFSVSDLQWYLTDTDPTNLRALPASAIQTFLQGVQTPYQAAWLSTESTYNASASLQDNLNGLKTLMSQLPPVAGTGGTVQGITAANLTQIMSYVTTNWTDPSFTAAQLTAAQTLLSSTLGVYFGATITATLVTDLSNLQAATGAAVTTAQNQLISDLSTNTSQYLFTSDSNAALYAAVASQFGTSDVVTQVILNYAALNYPPPGGGNPPTLLSVLTSATLIDEVNNPPQPPAITAAAFPQQYGAMQLLNMIVGYYNKINPSAADLQWLLQNCTTMGWLALDRLPYEATAPLPSFSSWQSLQQALQLMQQFPPVTNPTDPSTTIEWTDVWDVVITTPLAGMAALQTILVQFTGWDPVDTAALITYFGYAYPPTPAGITGSSFTQPQTYLSLSQTTGYLSLLGMQLSDFEQIIQPQLTAAQAGLLLQTLRAKYTAAQWPSVIQPVMDALRPQKRDALVNYLLAMSPTMQGTDDLFDYFLVDVEMQPGTPTSRIVLAHGTLQLFVTRCLMALEPNATADLADDDGWSQWSWMSEYQVWVANRKIFLYPENWFAPDLRSTMSPFFSDLINDLQQNQVTDDTVETAAINYLDDLDNVANLDVRACYYDVNTYLFHVVARVRGGTAYYYRNCQSETTWSAWTLVSVDISGDCLLCFVRNSRLFLAWPLFSESTQQPPNIKIPNVGSAPLPPPQKCYEIQLAVSEMVEGTWQPKRVSQNSLITQYYTADTLENEQDTLALFNFDLGAAGDNIVCTFGDSSIGGPFSLGVFSLTGCKGYPEAINWDGSVAPTWDIVPQFENTQFDQMQYQQVSSPSQAGLYATTIFNPVSPLPILSKSPSPFEVIYPCEFSLLDYIYILIELLLQNNSYNDQYARGKRLVIPMASFMPWFYEDNDRDYVIFPGFFSQGYTSGSDKGTAYTFSGIYTFVTDVIALVKQFVKDYLADPSAGLAGAFAQIASTPMYKTLVQQWEFFSSTQPQLMFMNFYHPLVCTIKAAVYNNGLPSIMTYAFQSQQTSFSFQGTYGPSVLPARLSVFPNYPVEDIDFTSTGSYSLYNWELFYDLPFYVGNQLSQNQQFQDAMTWYNYIFDPTGAQGPSAPQKYWITKPFYQFAAGDYQGQQIDTILTDIAADPSGVTITNLVNAVTNWRNNPFMPDVVCSTRQVAYAKAIFIAYVNNLIAWGDSVFTQNTTETRVQATQLYILADELMGPQPSTIPPAVTVPDQTYNQIVANVDVFGNALVDLENLVPNLNILPQKGAELPPSTSFSLLYFCIPPNDTLTTLWSTIADRLFKLRNSEDINGNYSAVPLFAPPINPALLVRAAAEGISISSIIADLNAPLPYYRFKVMSAKATELAQEISALGNALLAALEKKDAEMLSQLRAGQEVALQTQILQIRNSQVSQAQQQIAELQAAQAISQAKYNYYSSRPFMNTWEITQATMAGLGIVSQVVGTVLQATSGGTHLTPSFTGGGAGIGGSPLVTVTYGGDQIGDSTGAFASLFKELAEILQAGAALAGNIGSFQRRQDDWNFQAGQATLEIADYAQKIAVAQIAQTVASEEVNAQKTRITQATAMQTAIQTKYTNEALYSWMISQISTVYYQAYQVAYGIAKQAEQCYQYELATQSSFIQFGYWNTSYKGLLAGDQLLAAIKKMEASYLDTNRREYELTKNISLLSLNPRALLQLINTGVCDFDVPEFLFDLDYPGQYLRRLKSVSVTIPCVAGPMTTVACTLTLVDNQYRLLTSPGTGSDPYAENPVGADPRFVYNIGTIQAIALSSAQNDDGLFQLDFQDERYLPFECQGAIGSWHLEMNSPNQFSQLDLQQMTDVCLQLKYTAREGGSQLRTLAINSTQGVLKTIANQVPAAGLFRAFDLQHDFPNNWYSFMTDGTGTYNLTLSKLNFPFYTQNSGLKLTIKNLGLFVEVSTGASPALQVAIDGAAAQGMTTGTATSPYGENVQYLDLVAGFTQSLQQMSNTVSFAAAFSNFTTVGPAITGAWLILNYDLSA